MLFRRVDVAAMLILMARSRHLRPTLPSAVLLPREEQIS
jgi:hypothetical protein